MNTCTNCGGPITSKRNDAKTCSLKCRVALARKPKVVVADEEKHPFQEVINETIKKVQTETNDPLRDAILNANKNV